MASALPPEASRARVRKSATLSAAGASPSRKSLRSGTRGGRGGGRAGRPAPSAPPVSASWMGEGGESIGSCYWPKDTYIKRVLSVPNVSKVKLYHPYIT